MQKLITSFNKKGLDFNVYSNELGKLIMECKEITGFVTTGLDRRNGYYYKADGKLANMLANRNTLNIAHESAEFALLQAGEFVQELEEKKYNELDQEREIEFIYFYNHGKFLCLNSRAKKIEELCKVSSKMFEKFVNHKLVRIVKKEYRPDNYFVKKKDIDTILYDLLNIDVEQTKATIKAEEEKKKELIELAKKTNEKQVLYSFVVACTCENEDCDIDNIYVLIDKEGKITEEKIHNY